VCLDYVVCTVPKKIKHKAVKKKKKQKDKQRNNKEKKKEHIHIDGDERECVCVIIQKIRVQPSSALYTGNVAAALREGRGEH